MPTAEHIGDGLPELSATEAVAIFVGELRSLKDVIAEQSERISEMTKEIDRLRIRIKDPLREWLTKKEVAEDLKCSVRTVENKSRQDRNPRLKNFYNDGFWCITRADLEAYKRELKNVH